MARKKNKDQHYVSAFYLYNFTNREQRTLSGEKKRKTKIWHYDLKKDCIKERPIEKIATEPYLFSFMKKDGEYEHSLDDKLRKIEEKAAAALSKLCDIKSSFKKGNNFISLDNTLIEDILKFIVWQIRRHPSLVDDIHQSCKKWVTTNESDLNPKEMALKVLETFGRDKKFDFENLFQRKNKVIIFTTNPFTNFITTDEPLVRFNKSSTDGIGMEGTEIYFPLSSNMILWMYGDGDRKEFIEENDRAYLRKFNNYIAKSAKNYIFCESKEQLQSIVKGLKSHSI